MVHLKCVADISPLKCFKGVLEFISGRKSSKENYFVLKHKVRCLNLNLLIRYINFALTAINNPRLNDITLYFLPHIQKLVLSENQN